MNNLKKLNYIQFKNLKKNITKNKLLVFLHLDYVRMSVLQLFFSRCKENKINIIQYKLNFLKKIFKGNNVNKLLNGPSIILSLDFNDLDILFKLQKEFNFFFILSFFYKNRFIKKNNLLIKLQDIEILSKKLFIPSKYLSLFFFKRLNSLLSNILVKPLYNIYLLLRHKCQH